MPDDDQTTTTDPDKQTVTDPKLTDDPQNQDTPAASWRDDLPEDMRSANSLADIPDVATLAKNYIETKSLVGADTVKIPSRTAEPEEWEAFYAKAGRPEKAEDYQLPTEGLPEGYERSDADDKAFRDLSHKLGLNPVQTAEFYRATAELKTDAIKAIQKNAADQHNANIEAVKQEFGKALDERMALGNRLIDQFDTEDGAVAKYLKETGVGSNPVMFGFITRIAQQLSEDTILGAGKAATNANAPGEAKAKIGTLKQDADFMKAYYDRNEPGHAEAKAKMQKLYAEAYPEQTVEL